MSQEIDIEILIACVENRPLLWDKSNEDYKNKQLKSNAWKNVCEMLKENFEELPDKERQEFGDLVLKRWTNIRDQWVKHNKKEKVAFKSGAGASTTKKYVYRDQLMFLAKVPTSRKRATNTEDRNTESAYTEDAGELANESVDDVQVQEDATTENVKHTQKPTHKNAETARKRKRGLDEFELKMIKALEGGSSTEDRHLLFFKGIVPSIKCFNEEQTLDFQMGVLQLIKNIKTGPNVTMQVGYGPQTLSQFPQHLPHYPVLSQQSLQPSPQQLPPQQIQPTQPFMQSVQFPTQQTQQQYCHDDLSSDGASLDDIRF